MKENHVGWEATLHIWWAMMWRFGVGTLLQQALDQVFESFILLFLVDLFLDIWIVQWAIRSGLMDRYAEFTLIAENKKTGQSIYKPNRRVGLYVTYRIWWALTWRTSLVPTAILCGAIVAAVASHQSIFDFVAALDTPAANYFTLFVMVPVSAWALRESLADRYRSFRFRAIPKPVYAG